MWQTVISFLNSFRYVVSLTTKSLKPNPLTPHLTTSISLGCDTSRQPTLPGYHVVDASMEDLRSYLSKNTSRETVPWGSAGAHLNRLLTQDFPLGPLRWALSWRHVLNVDEYPHTVPVGSTLAWETFGAFTSGGYQCSCLLPLDLSCVWKWVSARYLLVYQICWIIQMLLEAVKKTMNVIAYSLFSKENNAKKMHADHNPHFFLPRGVSFLQSWSIR